MERTRCLTVPTSDWSGEYVRIQMPKVEKKPWKMG